MYDGVDVAASVVILHVERDEAVVAVEVVIDEYNDAGCRQTNFRAMMLEVISSCIHRLEMISPCQDEKPIHPRPGFVLQLIYVFSSLLLNGDDCTDRVCQLPNGLTACHCAF